MTDVAICFKTKLHLNKVQQSIFRRWAGTRRYAYNYALNLCNIYLDECERTGQTNKLLNEINTFDKWFNAGKYPLGFVRKGKGGGLIGSGVHDWAQNIPASVTQIAIKYDLKDGWKRCFKGLAKRPRFQGHLRKSSFTLSSVDLKTEYIHGTRLTLPKKTGTARLGDAIPYSTYKLGNTAFVKEGKDWFVSFCLTIPATEYYQQVNNRKPNVGLDLGVNIYAATSDGENYYAPEKLSELENKKKYINRKIGLTIHKNLMGIVSQCEKCCDKVKGISDKKHLCHACRDAMKPLYRSRKINKLRARVADINAKQQHIRLNMANQLTTDLVKSYDVVAIEDLSIKNMTASAKGDIESPGSMVKQKSGLNRSILNIAPFRVRTMLEYKSDKYGGAVVAVPAPHTSQTCSACGYVSSENRKTQALFQCVNCGYESNADTNAAVNIRNKGEAILSNS